MIRTAIVLSYVRHVLVVDGAAYFTPKVTS